MKREKIAFALTALISLSISTQAWSAPESKMPSMKDCQEECKKCSKMCEDVLALCQKKGGKYADNKQINNLKDCVASCNLSADYLSRNSGSHTKSCGFCAKICKTCAASCDALSDDKQIKECAAECHKCGDMCTEMSKMDMN